MLLAPTVAGVPPLAWTPLRFHYLPRRCGVRCGLCPTRAWVFHSALICCLSPDLSPSFPTWRIQLCVCIFAALVSMVTGTRQASGRGRKGQSLDKEVVTLFSFQQCWCQPGPLATPHPSLLRHRTPLPAGAQGMLPGLRAAGPWSTQALPKEPPSHHLWKFRLNSTGVGPGDV